jgi:hypothetical protein
MLLWTTLGLAMIGWLLYMIGGKIRNNWRLQTNMENVGGGMAALFSLILAFMIMFMIFAHTGNGGDIAKKEAHRGFLVVQYKSGVYDNSVYSQYNLLQQIDGWNCELSKMQELTHDYWVGIFVPDYWDNLEYITVNLFNDVTGGDRE